MGRAAINPPAPERPPKKVVTMRPRARLAERALPGRGGTVVADRIAIPAAVVACGRPGNCTSTFAFVPMPSSSMQAAAWALRPAPGEVDRGAGS